MAQFSNQMNAASVSNPANWSIIDTGLPSGVPVAISQVTGLSTNGGAYTGNCTSTAGCQAAVSVTIVSLVYNNITQTVTIHYVLSWTFTQPGFETSLATNSPPLGSTYLIGVPAFYFDFAGVDVLGQTLVYPANQKGF
jgi:hypothetical protein